MGLTANQALAYTNGEESLGKLIHEDNQHNNVQEEWNPSARY